MENEELPQYMRIAVSVAGRIADGQLAEGEKLSGRSKLSSEYDRLCFSAEAMETETFSA